MEDELLRRAEDLARRCEKTASVTNTGFLTPAQVYALESWAKHGTDAALLLCGGFENAERQVGFFLPEWMDAESFEPAEYLCAISLTAHFGEPGHRDYMGAALGLGIGREWLGDILVDGSQAWLVCLPSVKQHLLLNLDKVGRCGVTAKEIPLSTLPKPERKQREVVFSVNSLRLDAVCAGMFHLSRTSAAEAINQGLVSLNYSVCLKPDAPIRDGDILSLRGKGKGCVADAGGKESRKGRLFVKAEIYQ